MRNAFIFRAVGLLRIIIAANEAIITNVNMATV